MIFHRRPLAWALGLGIGLMAAAAAQAGTRIEKPLALDPGGRFTLDSQVGAIVLRGDASSGASIVVTSNRDDLEQLYDFRFEASPGEVHVSAKRKGEPSWFNWSESRAHTRFAISVPRRTSVAVHASGGSVDMADLQGEA